MRGRLFFVITILAVMASLVQGGYPQYGQAASPVVLEGTFLVVWGDGTRASNETRIAYFVTTDQYGTVKLTIDDQLLASLGGPAGLNQKAVLIQGIWIDVSASLLVQSISLAEGEKPGPDGIFGPQPWVSILCKFNDIGDEPNDLNYFKQMYSPFYPGLDHFWRQNSYNLANLEGSNAFGWYVLPYERAHYFDGDGNLIHEYAAHDCTEVAEPYVDFQPFVGINLMFNANLDCCAWGGGWYGCLDGICQVWRMTWEPPWGYQNIGVIAHETGHGFGLPHSLGNCRKGYDNRWDVLSDVWSNGSDPIWGTVGQHTISYHKEMLEWITEGQQYTSISGTLNTIALERLALPQTDNYLGARILINNLIDHFYTLEVRQPTDNPIDYDKWLPGFAVIIHEVMTGDPEPAVVIDLDDNCDTGDEGAMYKVGEVFTDQENGISVSIDSQTDTGYVVTINNRFVLMDGVNIIGASTGYLGESIPFTATVSPQDATIPITYTWQATDQPPIQHIGDTVDSLQFTWDDLGTKLITVTASNAGGILTATHIIEMESQYPVVSLSGPAVGIVGSEYTFTATSVPTDVVLPITYTWQASGQLPITHTGGLSDVVSYVWNNPGTQVITVSATNIDGSSADSYYLPIRMPPGYVKVSGPDTGVIQEGYTFTATVSPITTTVPITYVWSVDDEQPITHTAGITDTATFQWDTPGLHSMTVSGTNVVGSVAETWSVTIFMRVYIPISLRE